jgi:hypothetical protein
MKNENRLKKFRIIFISKGKNVIMETVGYSAIVEENEFRNKNHQIIDEFLNIEFVNYLN